MKKIRTLITIFIITLFFGNAFGQSVREYRETHRNLLAKQTQVKDKIKVEESQFYAKSLYGGEFADVYTKNWDNERINPYDGAVPGHFNIDMRDYVNPVKTRMITSHFGYRAAFGRNHYGVDLKASVGDTIYASFNGKVRLVKFDRSGYGFYIMIRHTNGVETLYAHLSKMLVKPNQIVRGGEPIALSGNTGRSAGPHLHYEIRYMGVAMNPEKLVDFTTHTPHFASVSYSEELRHGLRGGTNIASNKSTNKKRRKK